MKNEIVLYQSKEVHFIFSHCGLGSPLGVRGKGGEKRKNEMHPSKELAQHIEVRVDDETVWLNRNQIANLFARDVKTIGKHINNILGKMNLK